MLTFVQLQKRNYINVFNSLVFDTHKQKVYFAILQLIIIIMMYRV